MPLKNIEKKIITYDQNEVVDGIEVVKASQVFTFN